MKCLFCTNTRVALRDKTCAQCGTPTTVNALILRLGTRARMERRRLTTVRCPGCTQGVGMRMAVCPLCGTQLTVGAALGALFQPLDQRGRNLLQHPPPMARAGAQWLFLLGSLKVMGILLVGLAMADGFDLWGAALLSVPFFAMGLVVLVWIGPRPWQRHLATRASGPVKIGLLLNLLSCLLLTQHLILNSWRASTILAGGVAVVWFGGYVAAKVLWPILVALREIFGKTGAGCFDPSQPQGRKGTSE